MIDHMEKYLLENISMKRSIELCVGKFNSDLEQGKALPYGRARINHYMRLAGELQVFYELSIINSIGYQNEMAEIMQLMTGGEE